MAEASAHATANGLVLGRYRPLKPLGSGGMGSVWHAHDEKRDREVALKIVPRMGTAGPRAEREATAAAQLKHPACLRAYSLARDEGHVYIAYEYVPGRTLRHALDNGELDDARSVEAAAQILEGLAHAHERGIVHRDIKPSNVLLADGPVTESPPSAGISVRLLDFGLALVTEEETLTAAGDVPGTLAYISPERLQGKEAQASTDVWSTGVLLWEALARRHPFGGGRFLDVAKKIGRGAPSLGSVRPDLPKALVQLVDRALSVDPGKRPPAARLAADLRRAFRAGDRPGQAPLSRFRCTMPTVAIRLPQADLLRRAAPAVPAALLVGWTTENLPFFPAHWPVALAALAAVLTFLGPRLGLAFALAVPVLPLGNIALGLAIAYGIAACAWFALFWAVPRTGLLFVAGPLLAPLGALGLVPLAALPARDPGRRAAVAVAAVLSAGVVAALGGNHLPLAGGAAPDFSLGGVTGPLGAASALWSGLTESHGFLLETVALAAAAAVAGTLRHRGPWGGALFGALLVTLTLLVAPGAPALPLVGAAWVSALLLAAEPGPRRPLPALVERVRGFALRKPKLRALPGS
jgi:hypothetical protein